MGVAWLSTGLRVSRPLVVVVVAVGIWSGVMVVGVVGVPWLSAGFRVSRPLVVVVTVVARVAVVVAAVVGVAAVVVVGKAAGFRIGFSEGLRLRVGLHHRRHCQETQSRTHLQQRHTVTPHPRHT